MASLFSTINSNISMPIQNTVISKKFRFNIRPVGEREIEIIIPRSPNGAPILSSEFIEQHRLSDAEVDDAETGVLESIAIIR